MGLAVHGVSFFGGGTVGFRLDVVAGVCPTDFCPGRTTRFPLFAPQHRKDGLYLVG